MTIGTDVYSRLVSCHNSSLHQHHAAQVQRPSACRYSTVPLLTIGQDAVNTALHISVLVSHSGATNCIYSLGHVLYRWPVKIVIWLLICLLAKAMLALFSKFVLISFRLASLQSFSNVTYYSIVSEYLIIFSQLAISSPCIINKAFARLLS